MTRPNDVEVTSGALMGDTDTVSYPVQILDYNSTFGRSKGQFNRLGIKEKNFPPFSVNGKMGHPAPKGVFRN
jgi:hypothetical protein